MIFDGGEIEERAAAQAGAEAVKRDREYDGNGGIAVAGVPRGSLQGDRKFKCDDESKDSDAQRQEPEPHQQQYPCREEEENAQRLDPRARADGPHKGGRGEDKDDDRHRGLIIPGDQPKRKNQEQREERNKYGHAAH